MYNKLGKYLENIEKKTIFISSSFILLQPRINDNKIKLNNAINITINDAKKSWENGLRDKL